MLAAQSETFPAETLVLNSLLAFKQACRAVHPERVVGETTRRIYALLLAPGTGPLVYVTTAECARSLATGRERIPILMSKNRLEIIAEHTVQKHVQGRRIDGYALDHTLWSQADRNPTLFLDNLAHLVAARRADG